MDKIIDSLEKLAAIIGKTRNKKLKAAFLDFVRGFNAEMSDYRTLLSTLNEISNISSQAESVSNAVSPIYSFKVKPVNG